MSQGDLVPWTSMTSGCIYEGNIIGAFRFFEEMRLELEPDPVTVVVILQVCYSHGSVIEGRPFLIEGSLQNSILKIYANMGSIYGVFVSMKWKFGIEPDLNHYTCIVDLLARSGKLKETLAIILKVVAFPDSRSL